MSKLTPEQMAAIAEHLDMRSLAGPPGSQAPAHLSPDLAAGNTSSLVALSMKLRGASSLEPLQLSDKMPSSSAPVGVKPAAPPMPSSMAPAPAAGAQPAAPAAPAAPGGDEPEGFAKVWEGMKWLATNTAKDLSSPGQLNETLTSFNRGLTGFVGGQVAQLGGMIEAMGAGGSTPMPGMPFGSKAAGQSTFKAGQAIDNWSADTYKVNDPGVMDMLTGAVGTMTAMMAETLAMGPALSGSGAWSSIMSKTGSMGATGLIKALTGATQAGISEAAANQGQFMLEAAKANPNMTSKEAWDASKGLFWKEVVPDILMNFPLFSPGRKALQILVEGGAEGGQEGWQYVVSETHRGRPLKDVLMDPELLLSVGIGAVVGAGAKGLMPGQELTITELYDLMKAERGLKQGGGVLQGPKEVPGMSTSGADPYGIHRIAELVPFLEEDAVDILIERFTKEVQTLQAAPADQQQHAALVGEFVQYLQEEKERRARKAAEDAWEQGTHMPDYPEAPDDWVMGDEWTTPTDIQEGDDDPTTGPRQPSPPVSPAGPPTPATPQEPPRGRMRKLKEQQQAKQAEREQKKRDAQQRREAGKRKAGKYKYNPYIPKGDNPADYIPIDEARKIAERKKKPFDKMPLQVWLTEDGTPVVRKDDLEKQMIPAKLRKAAEKQKRQEWQKKKEAERAGKQTGRVVEPAGREPGSVDVASLPGLDGQSRATVRRGPDGKYRVFIKYAASDEVLAGPEEGFDDQGSAKRAAEKELHRDLMTMPAAQRQPGPANPKVTPQDVAPRAMPEQEAGQDDSSSSALQRLDKFYTEKGLKRVSSWPAGATGKMDIAVDEKGDHWAVHHLENGAVVGFQQFGPGKEGRAKAVRYAKEFDGWAKENPEPDAEARAKKDADRQAAEKKEQEETERKEREATQARRAANKKPAPAPEPELTPMQKIDKHIADLVKQIDEAIANDEPSGHLETMLRAAHAHKDELEGKKPAPEKPKAKPKPKVEPENESWRGKSLGKEEIEKARARYEENADENGDNDPALREASIWIGDEEGNMIGRIDERHTDNEQDVTDVIEYLVDEARQVFGKDIDWTNTDLMVVDKNGNVIRRVKFDEDGNYSEDEATEPQDDEDGDDYQVGSDDDLAFPTMITGDDIRDVYRTVPKDRVGDLWEVQNIIRTGITLPWEMGQHDFTKVNREIAQIVQNLTNGDVKRLKAMYRDHQQSGSGAKGKPGSKAYEDAMHAWQAKRREFYTAALKMVGFEPTNLNVDEEPEPPKPGKKLKDAATKKAGEKKATAAKAEEKLAPKPKAEKGPTAASTAAKLAEEDGIYLRPGEVPVEVHGDDPERRVYITTHRANPASGVQMYQLVVNLPIGGNKRIMKQLQGSGGGTYYGIESAKAAVQALMDKQAEIDAEAMPDMPAVPAKLTDGKFTETVIEISVRGKGKEMVKRPSRAFVYGNSGLALTGGMGQDGNNMGWAITHMRSGYVVGVSGTSIKAGKDLLVKVAALTDWTVDMIAMPKKNPELWQKIGQAVREIRDGGNPGPLAARAGAAAPGIMAQKSKEVDVSKRKATQRHRHPTPDRDAVIAEFGWTVATQAELDAAMSEKNVKALLRIADLVGLDIEFYSGKMNGTEGFYHPYDLSVAIHVQCSQPIGYVIAHELGHYLHLHARKEMALLADRVELLDQPSRAKMTALLRFYHPTKLTREVMADIAADQMINNDGIRFLLAQLEPSVQLRIRNKVIMGLRAIAKKLKIAAAGTTHMEGLESLERRVEDSYRDVLRGVVIPRRKRLPPGYMPSSDQAALFSLQPFDPSQPPPSMKPIQAARVKPKQINPRYKPVTKRRTTKIRRHPDWVPEDTKRDIDGYYRARRKLTGPAAKDGLWQWGRHWLSRENMEKWYGRIFNYMHMAQLSVDRATAQMQDSMKQMGLPAAFIPAKRIDRAISNDVIRMGQLYNGWGGAVKMFFEKGITELDDSSKKINQIGLLQILMDKNYEIAGNYDYFNQYLIDRQILEVERAKKANGETFINWKNPLHVERYKQAQANVAACEGKFQLWSTAADEITSWMNDLLEYSYRAGVMSKEQRDHVKSMYQSYVPLHLMSGWDPRSAINATGQNVKAKHLLDNMGLLKEGEFIIPPIEACLNNAAYLVRATMMAKQSARMAETVDKLSEISKDAEKITGREWLGNQKAPDRHPTSITRGELLDAAGVPTGDAAAEVLIDNPQGDPIGDHYGPFEIDQVVSTFGLSEAQRDTMAQLWIVSGVQSPGTISFIRNGKVVYYEVNEHIWAMFSGQGHGSHDVAVSVLGTMARLQRLGATSYSPKFPFRNMFRDVGQALVTSQHLINIQKGPIRAVTDLVMMGPRLLNAMFQMGKVQAGLRSEIYEEAMRNYAFYSDLFSMDLESSEKRALKIVQMSGSGKPIRNKTGTKLEQQMIDLFEATEGERNYLVKHPLVAMTLFASNLESATRLAVYKKTRNDLYATKKMDAKDARLEAGLNAREASTDFQRRGTSLPTMGVMWSFLHAGLQGMDLSRRVLFSRSVKNKRYNWVMAFLTITLHSLANWWANKDEEWYQKANRWQKDMFWIWSPDHGETRYMVPKPFQLGYFFGTIWEHALQKISDKDPKAFDRLGPELLSMINPFQATAVAPMMVAGAEMAANYSLFRGGKIVSSSQEKIISEYQYHVRTSLMARKLASLLDHAPVPEHFKSPVLLDHWARSSFGAAADYVQALTDVLIRASDPQMRRTKPAVPKLFNVIASDWPLALNAMIEVGEPATTRYMADLFDMTERARTVKATFDRATNGQLDQMALAEILEDDLPYLAMYDQLAATVAMSTQIIGAIKTIEMEGFGAYTPTQKRDEIERLQRYMHLTVEAVVTELYTAEKEGQEYVDRMSPQIRAFRESIRRARSQQ